MHSADWTFEAVGASDKDVEARYSKAEPSRAYITCGITYLHQYMYIYYSADAESQWMDPRTFQCRFVYGLYDDLRLYAEYVHKLAHLKHTIICYRPAASRSTDHGSCWTSCN